MARRYGVRPSYERKKEENDSARAEYTITGLRKIIALNALPPFPLFHLISRSKCDGHFQRSLKIPNAETPRPEYLIFVLGVAAPLTPLIRDKGFGRVTSSVARCSCPGCICTGPSFPTPLTAGLALVLRFPCLPNLPLPAGSRLGTLWLHKRKMMAPRERYIVEVQDAAASTHIFPFDPAERRTCVAPLLYPRRREQRIEKMQERGREKKEELVFAQK